MLILSLGHSNVIKVLCTEPLFWLDTLPQFVQVVKLSNSTVNKPKTLGQSPKKMGNRGTRFLRKVCESEEGWDKTPIFYLISSKSNIFG